MVGDAGIEPAWSRLRGECISHLCQSPVNVGEPMRAPSLGEPLARVPQRSVAVPSKKRCRMMESNHLLAIIDRGLDLRANPAWCAVRELNPHLLVVGQLFWSVELPAQILVRDAGIEPASSRLKGECIATSANPAP